MAVEESEGTLEGRRLGGQVHVSFSLLLGKREEMVFVLFWFWSQPVFPPISPSC